MMSDKRKVGIFGGTFDPIHIGHLVLSQEALFQLALDCIYLAPAGDPPHKQNRQITPIEHRIRMAELATNDHEQLHVSRIDADRVGPHYTIDAVQLLSHRLGPHTELYFLMGMDSLRDLPTWHKAMWLVQHCQLVALRRHGVSLDWDRLNEALPGVQERVVILEMPALEIASHTLQERVRTGQPIRYQVPAPVEEYIHQEQLYRTDGTTF